MVMENRSRPSDETETAPCYESDASVTVAPEPIGYLEHFARRVILDALNEATADYWRRRAKALRAARHDPTRDYLPAGQLQAARVRWSELTEAAAACENMATICEMYGNELLAAEVADVIEELAA